MKRVSLITLTLFLSIIFTGTSAKSQPADVLGPGKNVKIDSIQSDVPTLLYASYWGGGDDDEPENMIIDNEGNIIIAGQSKSLNLPVTDGAFQTTNGGKRDIFVAKFAADYSILWATYIGGDSSDYANGLAVDNNGNIYVGGTTASLDFPVLNAFQNTLNDDDEGVLIKFNSEGTLLWSTYFGGKDDDDINGVAVDDEGRVYITGETESDDFYITPGAFQENLTGHRLCFVTRFLPDGDVIWSTFFGGNDEENGNDIIVDRNQDIIIIGEAYSIDCPITPGFYQDSIAGSDDALLMKMDSSGSLIFATVLGGTDDDDGRKVGVDHENNIYIIGDLISTDFPTTEGAFQSTLGGEHDAFVTKFDNSGQLIWSTYLGGELFEFVYGIDVDNVGTVYVYGDTESEDFPVTPDALQGEMSDPDDMFITTLDSVGNIIWSTFWGGDADEDASELRFRDHKLYIVGTAENSDIPITPDAWQLTNAGGEDGYFAIFEYEVLPTGIAFMEQNDFLVYPQPASNFITVSFGDDLQNMDLQLQLYDITGKLVLSESKERGKKKYTINAEALPAGVYYLGVVSDGKRVTGKSVILR
ncbi:MAG: SBBP repeat-containing protein [Bacteroidales bacterium]|nr:SBBP repeat-containing protein [Bacteroidales bacterium]